MGVCGWALLNDGNVALLCDLDEFDVFGGDEA